MADIKALKFTIHTPIPTKIIKLAATDSWTFIHNMHNEYTVEIPAGYTGTINTDGMLNGQSITFMSKSELDPCSWFDFPAFSVGEYTAAGYIKIIKETGIRYATLNSQSNNDNSSYSLTGADSSITAQLQSLTASYDSLTGQVHPIEYGMIYLSASGYTATSTTAYVTLSGFDSNDNLYSGVSADYANNRIVVSNTGVYDFSYAIAYSTNLSGVIIDSGIFNDDSMIAYIHSQVYHPTEDKIQFVFGRGILSISSVPKNITLQAKTDSATATILTINCMNITDHRIQ